MKCFSCFSCQMSNRLKDKMSRINDDLDESPEIIQKRNTEAENISIQKFTFRELATATNSFRNDCLIGEGGFGRVYKGLLKAKKQVVAVKQLDRNGLQGNKEVIFQVQKLSHLNHPNLVNLIGYCVDGDQRLLVYEYMAGGSIEKHLRDIGEDKKPLDWFTRIKIASGVARALEYLHDKVNPPIIYRDLKPSNILLDEEFNANLDVDYGLINMDDDKGKSKMHGPSRVVGTYGYCAPEYSSTGILTAKSDIYSFGVLMLELITGRKAVSTIGPTDEQNLITWAQPFFRDPRKFPDLADPYLNKEFPEKDLNQAVAIAAMCLQDEAAVRPFMSDVVTALSFLAMSPNDVVTSSSPPDNRNHRLLHTQSQCSCYIVDKARSDENEASKYWDSYSAEVGEEDQNDVKDYESSDHEQQESVEDSKEEENPNPESKVRRVQWTERTVSSKSSFKSIDIRSSD